jgi:hypothetical protein
MNPDRRQQIDRLLDEALDRKPEERPAFLEQACAGDLELRKEVKALREAHDQAGSFVIPTSRTVLFWHDSPDSSSINCQPATGRGLHLRSVVDRLRPGRAMQLRALDPPAAIPQNHPTGSLLGRRLGPYEVLALIG